ncbi:dihydrolipoyllysine-residue succinyltransferase component of 2-oxoglutarate dehydrogenase complex [Pseudohongiella nitratireducens]|uniref:Dihydrolipoyllysine-residue succinyltransferase component of 2-oxoglutarate dehydrogenase complex n=1 Tax=Pseudohongiella nitratireducens TaxID=1768907 RepID=A0A916QN17_9GAMM|nr:2-oxoglutarate dehydrogenase complex dihydrolipoyllysine-residue succinyltransferase [Pseudohongiella nitratireducens]MDF1623891.1 2-oxoglutarate dehydrogenase complex dihydrolipoyllysine-residue succinyltransferase [Pseudohongiella nitratireducens]GFZ82363.1 dihydrolipoyllysine-residue succinyltransferase component of 2-oxoglutarate dehydrogenase complex [Pseudohongiella nitratireducens]|tara:strand:+ start:5124 stop:6389 length:1266 start_codon:yes stop_codon:yes gene_type:complete
MAIEIKAPQLPESVPDGTIASWHKQEGDAVKRDELLVDIETDKVVIEVVAPADGVLEKIVKDAGDTIVSNEVVATLKEGAAGESKSASSGSSDKKDDKEEKKAASSSADNDKKSEKAGGDSAPLSPAAKKLAEENNIDPSSIDGSGKDGRITKEDVMKAIEGGSKSEAKTESKTESKPQGVSGDVSSGRVEERVPMSRLRAKVAERLLEASQSTAMLTTFNEVNMQPVMELRNRYKDLFEKAHDGTRLGFMSFFVRASVEALKRFPAVNASIDGSDIVYHGYQDIGVAVSSPRGLVVPVLRNSDHMSLAQVESKIREYGLKARDGKLSIDEMTGGTFTISNGGVFGSLLSTPILNPPQTAILGMHKIQERPMAVNGKVEILPMMYLALSYDHRMIDGKEAVQFLVTIKELLEDPARILLEI